MNKLFTKIASLTLGLALAAGAGAFLGSRAAEGVNASETVDYTGIGTGSLANNVITWSNIPGITITQNKGSSSSNPANYVTPTNAANSTLRVYKGNVFAFVASTDYSILGVKLNNSGSSSYVGKEIWANTVWESSSSSISTSDTTNLTLTNCAAPTTSSVSTIETKSASGVQAIYISADIQMRPTSVTVKYIKPDATSPTGISCDSQTIDVVGSVNLTNKTSFTPAAAVCDLSFAIKEGSEYVELDSETGVVTGVKGGSATITITPSDTSAGATSIDVVITINSIAVPQVTIGKQYAIYVKDAVNSVNYELTGVESTLGVATLFTGDVPSCSHLFTIEEGYFENTVAFSDGTNYLALTTSDNKLNTSNSVTKQSSWIVTRDSTTDASTIFNAAYSDREIQYNYSKGSPRFACYKSTQTAISLYEYEDHALVDFTIESEVSVYKTSTATIGVTYNPADASDKTLSWSSDDTSIATVDSNGVVTGVAVGTTTITATKVIDESNVERTCTVTVLNNASAHRGTNDDPFNVADAVQVAKGVFVEDPDGTAIDLTKEYYVYGMITNTVNKTITTLTFWIGDNASQISASTGGFEVYKAAKVYGEALATRYDSNEKVAADFELGDYIRVKSTLTVYNGTPETTQSVADIVYSSRIEAGSYSAEVVSFAEDLLGYACDASGETAPSVKAWGNFATFYAGDTLSADDKAALVGAPAVEHETPVTNDEKVEAAMAKYDYVVGKYNKTLGQEEEYPDFINRNPAALKNISAPTIGTNSTNTAIIVVSVIAIVSVSSIGVLLVLKRRKNHI